ncbi:dipeptidase A. Cysteine peptidase. MEROPS family C69 [Ligilactobacillus sp. WC1T17]|uniref:Dipeptidase n=1 Tax=Ligilactobacillus ruminis TaxID=1623 RepID=A0ABY1AER8_9LACO|nr:dipeptidase A. Cysteine peptidase. MEROPS family C69 [Ligilactobacillus ruminis]
MKDDACTSIMVGKKAAMEGFTMIARNDDTFSPLEPQKFVVNEAVHGQKGRHIKSWLNGFEMDLPEDAYRYTAVPNVNYKEKGYYEESGINEKNVAMSATESTYSNECVLAFDPLVEDGLDEDCIVNVVLPYVDSARHAVRFLGKLIKKYGSPAGNSVLFSDKDEIWYMEIVTGHHWVAQRIPDDCVAVAPNRVSIQAVDFNDNEYFMWSEGIREFVEKYKLNPDFDQWNVRHIFGTYSEQDRHYNTPRRWYAHKRFDPSFDCDPQDPDIPFIRKATHKISREEIEAVLGSHYQDTVYDPLGKLGSESEKYRYRPIGLNRTQNAHILQIRDDVEADLAGVMWLCIGGPTFTPFVPFFTNINDTDPSYNNTSFEYNANDAWWFYKSFAALVESHYSQFVQKDVKYLEELNRYYRSRVAKIIKQAQNKTGKKLTKFLTKANQETVAHTKADTDKLWGELFKDSIMMSKLTFKMDKNL